jgi:RNA polymerase sigma factor (sigma-70 family)
VTSEPIQPEPHREVTLLERVGRGDKSAVPLLLDKYGPLVWSIARRQVGAEAAEDVVQEVFIQIWKNADRYDPERASEATYITTIARRRLIDQRRKLGRQPSHEELQEDAGIPDDRLERVDLGDDARVAALAMAQLKPEQQKVLKLSIVDGLSHTQIAELTHLPLGTVKSHARRGLERVRALLQEQQRSWGEES